MMDLDDVSDGLGTDLDEDIVEGVAKAMVNADNDSFGKAWPWPDGDAPWAKEVRDDAMRVARIAIRAYKKAVGA